jgi:hypothetical protein
MWITDRQPRKLKTVLIRVDSLIGPIIEGYCIDGKWKKLNGRTPPVKVLGWMHSEDAAKILDQNVDH